MHMNEEPIDTDEERVMLYSGCELGIDVGVGERLRSPRICFVLCELTQL